MKQNDQTDIQLILIITLTLIATTALIGIISYVVYLILGSH